jgi:hypothetical protein
MHLLSEEAKQLFDLSKMVMNHDEYTPTEPCYLCFEVTHEGRRRIIALQVAEKKQDGTIVFVDSHYEYIDGDYPDQMIKIHYIVERYRLKYKCVEIFKSFI